MGSLEAVGLSDVEERCYLLLVERGDRSLADLAGELQMRAAAIRQSVAALESKGFVTRTPGRRPTFAAARPDLAVEALILRREDELDRARREAQRLAALLAGRTAYEPARPVGLISGREAVARWWVQVQRSARREVCIFDRPPYVLPPTRPNPVEQDLLPKGIVYRVLYDETSLDDADKLEAARASMSLGEQARVIAGIPIKLIIADGSLALTHDSADVHEHAVIVHPSALLTGLVALFESLWSRGTPLRSGEDGHPELDELDRTILALLASGSKDERIARRSGIGLRTVRRRVARLMEMLQARTRFQAALRASERGWL